MFPGVIMESNLQGKLMVTFLGLIFISDRDGVKNSLQ